MNTVSPTKLRALRLGSFHPAKLASVRLAPVLTRRAQRTPRRSTIPTLIFHSVSPFLSRFRYAPFRHTAARQFYNQPPLPTHQAKHSSRGEDRVAITTKTQDADDSSPLTQASLNAIFGQEIDREGAAELLSRLQKQRREGTLDQSLPYPAQLIDRGLEYLRSKYPIDEDAAIIARLDRELDGHWSLPQMDPENSPTGRSGLDEIGRINKAKREIQEAQIEAELKELAFRRMKRAKVETKWAADNARPEEAASKRTQRVRALIRQDEATRSIQETSGNSSRKSLVAFSEAHERRMQRVDDWIRQSNKRVAQLRADATLQNLPQMTRWQRLWRSGLFTFSTVGFGLAFGHFYTPPSQNARLFPDVSPAAAFVGAIIAVNVLICLMWRIPYAWKFMNRYFMVVPAVPRAFSMLGAEFSHQKWPHLGVNMLAMWLLGTQLYDDIGRGPFLALVLCGAVIPSFCSLLSHVMMRILITGSLGASGIVTTFIGASCVLHEGRKVIVPGLPPEITSWINTAVILPVFVLIEVVNFSRYGLMPKTLIKSGRPHLDYLGHLAGYATGIGAGCLIRQTNPYWGGIKRKSFWTQEDPKIEDSDAELRKT